MLLCVVICFGLFSGLLICLLICCFGFVVYYLLVDCLRGLVVLFVCGWFSLWLAGVLLLAFVVVCFGCRFLVV